MSHRRFVVFALALSSVAGSARARAQSDAGRFTDGLTPGDYIRFAVASVAPVNPQGSLKDWNRGQGLSLMWENWDTGSGGVGRLGYGLFVDYSLLPLNEKQFVADFATGPNGRALTASNAKAGMFQVGVNTRIRIPAPFIMPSISIAFGFIDWRPEEIQYTATGGNGSAKQQERRGGAINVAAGLDKNIYDRFAIFGEAVYSYGFTSFGAGLAGSGSSCLTTNCDLLKNTPLGSIRGGLRVRASR